MKSEKILTENGKSVEKQNFIETLRKNLDIIMEERKLKIRELAELCDITFDTLKTFLYDKEAKDCRLSTVVKLSKGLEIPIGMLIGSLDEEALELLKMYRSLPKSSKSLIDWHIRNQMFLHQHHDKTRFISVMNPLCASNGNLKKTGDYDKLDISGLNEELYHKVFFGIKIPCEHYLPHYMQNDILLIANDREAMKGENTVIMIGDNICITNRVKENEKIRYYGIRDNMLHAKDLDTVQVVGYIAKVISE